MLKYIVVACALVIFIVLSCGDNGTGEINICLEMYERCADKARGRAMDQEEWKEMIHSCEMKRLNCEWSTE